MNKIYLAGGCFWGVEHYFSLLKGVQDVISGYAQSDIENPTYKDLTKNRCSAVEAVEITYDENLVSYEKLLDLFLRIVDPISLNRQGNDIGIQYRSGIYFTNLEEKKIAEEVLNKLQSTLTDKIMIEVEELKNFYKAEDYHQDYLVKNPSGYCHVNFGLINEDELK